MNTLELLYNKALMKAAADKDEHVKKTKVWNHPLMFIWQSFTYLDHLHKSSQHYKYETLTFCRDLFNIPIYLFTILKMKIENYLFDSYFFIFRIRLIASLKLLQCPNLYVLLFFSALKGLLGMLYIQIFLIRITIKIVCSF